MDLIYPELSYKIVGCAYTVFNTLGGGHREAIYQKALGIEFINCGILFKGQQYYDLKYCGKPVGKGYFDFCVEEKIIVELKAKGQFTRANYDQMFKYLQESGLKLGLLIRFGEEQVFSRRVVNFRLMQ
jgi:GxxExxY protein